MKVIKAIILPAGPKDTEIMDMKREGDRGHAGGKSASCLYLRQKEIVRSRNSISISSS